jgi:AAA domain
MKITKGNEPLGVEHPVFVIVGDPGIGKTSLLQTADKPLTLDFDQGAHRAANRKDVVSISSWKDVADLSPEALAPYQTVGVDTVGRCIDLMAQDIIEGNPRVGRGGSLTIEGWGVLKTRFRGWLAMLRTLGKDVVLLAHAREERDGDTRIVRADIAGGSYAEVMRSGDMVGYLTMNGRHRTLDFSPSEKAVGKNTAQFPVMQVPVFAAESRYLGDLMDKTREAICAKTAESAKMASQIADFRTLVEEAGTPVDLSYIVGQIAKEAVAQPVRAAVRKLLWDKAKAMGLEFSKDTGAFYDPKRQPAAAGAAR